MLKCRKFCEHFQKLLADTRLSENAHHVRALERQIEYTRRFIERKRNAVSAWQNSTMPLLHKEELLALEGENSESARKIVIWQRENRRLALILDAMKERESEMQFAVDRCYQRKKRAQDECHRMRCRIVYLSSVLDSRFTCDAQGESSDTEPPSKRNGSVSSTECAYQPQYMIEDQGKDEENAAVASSRQTGQETQLSLHIRRTEEMGQQEEDSEDTQREYSIDEDRDEAGEDDSSGFIDKDDLRTMSIMFRRCNPGLIDQMHFLLPPYENF
uniref:EF-hand domain-containing protein n=1 Tax=Ascaris lumbricoides TaxID=6252 RepID=A0A0M3I9C8_ASCLU